MSIDFVGGCSPSFGHLDRSQKCFLKFSFDAGKKLLQMSGPTWRKFQIQIPQSGCSFGLWVSMRRAKNCMCRATLELVLKPLPKSKLSPSVLVEKPCLSTFLLKWNVWIWCRFVPPKLQSPLSPLIFSLLSIVPFPPIPFFPIFLP